MSAGSLIGDLLKVAKAAASVIGGPSGALAVGIGKTVIELIDKAKTIREIAQADDVVQLDAARDDLIARVNAHADAVIGRLRGD
jgi:hypothetical protein